jgi:hypothetical protein
MAWITADDLSSRLDTFLRPEPDEVRAAFWSSQVIQDAVDYGQHEILSRLSARGYTSTQIANWYRASEYQIDCGLWYLVSKGVIAAPVEGERPDALKRCDELDTVAITDEFGTLIFPAGTPLMTVGQGNSISTNNPQGERYRDTVADPLGNTWRRW